MAQIIAKSVPGTMIIWNSDALPQFFMFFYLACAILPIFGSLQVFSKIGGGACCNNAQMVLRGGLALHKRAFVSPHHATSWPGQLRANGARDSTFVTWHCLIMTVRGKSKVVQIWQYTTCARHSIPTA